MTWTTCAQEQVTIGDLVALSVLLHTDAVGRILGENDGKIHCVLTRGNNCRPGDMVTVEEHQLLLKVSS